MAEDGDLEVAERSFNRMHAEQSKAGFREGAAAAEEKALQEGFEMGYQQAMVTSLSWGQLLGEISCLKVYAERSGREELAKRLAELQSETERAKHACSELNLKHQLEQLTETPEQEIGATHSCSGYQQSATVEQLLQEQGSSQDLQMAELRRQTNELRSQLMQPTTHHN